MIRVNLIDASKRAKRRSVTFSVDSTRVWVVLYACLAGLWMVAAIVYYFRVDGERTEAQTRNETIRKQLQTAQRSDENLEALRKEIEEAEALQTLVDKLDKGRVGPTRVLVELARILTRGGKPTIDPAELEDMRRNNPLAGFNPNWDARRLWLLAMSEKDRIFSIKGVARSNEDVAEFLQRLSLSELFQEVELQRTESQTLKDVSVPFINFELRGRLNY